MRRLSLPVAQALGGDSPPTARDVRQRLGGPGQSEAGAGTVVRFVEDPGAGTLGVIVYKRGDELDVYLGDGWLRRTQASAVTALEVQAPTTLAGIATDALVFYELRQGERVRYLDAQGSIVSGVLLEKCRYGAIVVTDEKRLVGIGFRKLWPLASSRA